MIWNTFEVAIEKHLVLSPFCTKRLCKIVGASKWNRPSERIKTSLQSATAFSSGEKLAYYIPMDQLSRSIWSHDKGSRNNPCILSKFDHDSFQSEIHRLFGG